MGNRIRLRDLYTNYIDNDMFYELGDITRDGVQELEKEEFGEVGAAIKWENWDRIIKETKGMLANYRYHKRNPQRRRGLTVYIYDIFTKELLRVFDSALEAGEFTHTSAATVIAHINSKKPYNNFFFSQTELEPKDVPTYKWIYVYDLTTKKLLNSFKTAADASRYYKLPIPKVGYLMQTQGGRYPSRNLLFSFANLWQEEPNQYGFTRTRQ